MVCLLPFSLSLVQVGSVEIERVCNTAHPLISETAAIGIPLSGGGPEQLHIVAVLKEGAQDGGGQGGQRVEEDGLKRAFNRAIQQKLNPLFKVSGGFGSLCLIAKCDT